MTSYAVLIEGSGESYSGYVPDLPECVATGRSVDEIEARLREAIVLHIESLRTNGEAVPEPTTAAVRTVDIA